MNFQNKRRANETSNHRHIAPEIVVELVERWIKSMFGNAHEKRVPISGRAYDTLGRNAGISSWPIFNNELLADPLGQPLSNEAGNDVCCASWGKPNHNADRPRRIRLRPCYARHRRQSGSAYG